VISQWAGQRGALVSDLTASLPPLWTFSRASQGTQVQSGVLSYAPNNVLLRSGDLSQSAWVKQAGLSALTPVTGPDGSATASQMTIAGAASGFYQQISGLLSGARYEPSFWINPTSTSGILAVTNPANQTNGDWRVNLASLTAGVWTRITRSHASVSILNEFTALSGSCGIYPFTVGGASYVIAVYGFQLEAGTATTTYNPTTTAVYYGPRFETSPAGWLGESQATNLVPNNSNTGAVVGTPGTLPTGWSVATAAGLTTNVTGVGTSSGGLPYVDIRIFGTSTGVSYELNVVSFITMTLSVPYVTSLWSAIVAGSTSGISAFLAYIGGSGAAYRADLNLASASLTRTQGTATQALVGGGLNIRLAPAGAVAIDITVRIGGLQFEQSSFATSLIATTTAAATRAADNLTLDLTQLPGLQTATGYGVAMDFSVISDSQANTVVLAASITGDGNNTWYLITDGGGNVRVVSVVAGVTQVSAYLPMRTAGLTNRLALSVTPAGIRWTMNGAAVIAATNAGQPLMGTLAVGRLANTAGYYTNMHATLVTLTPGPQSDAALIARAY